jgi:hypothetical protein
MGYGIEIRKVGNINIQRKKLQMKNISTGFGLCAIAAAVALYPVLDRFAPIAKEAHAGVPVSAITSAALAQIAPTIVWYGTTAYGYSLYQEGKFETLFLLRAWSDGRVECRRIKANPYLECTLSPYSCIGPWILINDPAQGLAAASDSDFNGQVDGADLGRLLGNWGDAPRDQIPISDCPLNLINP